MVRCIMRSSLPQNRNSLLLRKWATAPDSGAAACRNLQQCNQSLARRVLVSFTISAHGSCSLSCCGFMTPIWDLTSTAVVGSLKIKGRSSSIGSPGTEEYASSTEMTIWYHCSHALLRPSQKNTMTWPRTFFCYLLSVVWLIETSCNLKEGDLFGCFGQLCSRLRMLIWLHFCTASLLWRGVQHLNTWTWASFLPFVYCFAAGTAQPWLKRTFEGWAPDFVRQDRTNWHSLGKLPLCAYACQIHESFTNNLTHFVMRHYCLVFQPQSGKFHKTTVMTGT